MLLALCATEFQDSNSQNMKTATITLRKYTYAAVMKAPHSIEGLYDAVGTYNICTILPHLLVSFLYSAV